MGANSSKPFITTTSPPIPSLSSVEEDHKNRGKEESWSTKLGSNSAATDATDAAATQRSSTSHSSMVDTEITTITTTKPPPSPPSASAAPEGGGCPMRNTDGTYKSSFSKWTSIFPRNPHHHPPPPPPSSQDTTKTTTTTTTTTNPPIIKYDVYSRPIDPKNHMPSSSDVRNTLPSSIQSQPLDTNRVSSTIPKGGSSGGETWMYPSPQMFYNALVRKGKVSVPTTTTTAILPQEKEEEEKKDDNNNINTQNKTGVLLSTEEEESMASVVAIHNCMNEATWRRVLQWEEVLNPPSLPSPPTPSNRMEKEYEKRHVAAGAAAAVGPALSRFEGRPTDLSPKAFFKHYLLGHPLPFDRHDWIVTRTILPTTPTTTTTTNTTEDASSSNSSSTTTTTTPPSTSTPLITKDVRYVIDYYHDESSASNEEGSGYPTLHDEIGPNGRVRSLLVDVRPALDSWEAMWGRMIGMPLARRGCATLYECIFKSVVSDSTSDDDDDEKKKKKSEFEPLPLFPSEGLKKGYKDSQQVWESIQMDARMKRGVGAMDEKKYYTLPEEEKNVLEDDGSSSSLFRKDIPLSTKKDAQQYASTYSRIRSSCIPFKEALQHCSSQEECEQAMVGMTICAGQYMCPLQHTSLLDSLKEGEEKVSSSSSSLGRGVNNNTNKNEMKGHKEEEKEVMELRIHTALDILTECVSNYDAKASMTKRAHPELFEKIIRSSEKDTTTTTRSTTRK